MNTTTTAPDIAQLIEAEATADAHCNAVMQQLSEAGKTANRDGFFLQFNKAATPAERETALKAFADSYRREGELLESFQAAYLTWRDATSARQKAERAARPPAPKKKAKKKPTTRTR